MSVKRKSGFALLEATAALFVATVGLSSIVHLYQFGTDRLRTVQERNLALRMLRNEMEYRRAVPWEDLTPVKSQPFATQPPELSHLYGARTAVDIVKLPEFSDSLRRITVRIVWASEHGRRVDEELTTLVARRESQ